VAGGLLNATFGNAAELIISIAALNQGLFLVVRTSLVGSIVGQLLLVLGTSLLAAGLKHRKLAFSRSLVQINFTLMALAVVAIGLPSVVAALDMDQGRVSHGLLAPTLSALLITIYALAVVFSLRRQPEEEGGGGGVARWPVGLGLLVLAGSTAGIVFVSGYLVGSVLPLVEATGISQVFVGLILIPVFSNVVDHIVAITVALKNRMDLSITISVGSAAQVACLVLPGVVLIGTFMSGSAGLVFAPIELLALAAGLALMVPVLLDGESNWLEGAELLTCYLILAVVLWNF
jgi:Ca2+:H+ antiporter